jgi:hypothetical protein
MTNPITPRVRVGSVLRDAAGRRFVVKSIRRKQPDDSVDDELELEHQRDAKRRRRPQLNSGFSYARPRVDEKGPT